MARSLPLAEALPVLRRLAVDASPPVRRESLIALTAAFPREAQPELERAVLDPSASVRETARFLLRPRQLDFAALYRDSLSHAATARRLASAIAGLSEVGAAPDAQSVAPLLSHPSARVRRAAVKCVMRLAGDDFAERIAILLQDPSRAVSVAARDALRRHARTLGRNALMSIFDSAEPRHARLHVIPLLAALKRGRPGQLCLRFVRKAKTE